MSVGEIAVDFGDGIAVETMTCRKCKVTKGKEGWQPKQWERRSPYGNCRDCKAEASKAYWQKRKGKMTAKKPPAPATLNVASFFPQTNSTESDFRVEVLKELIKAQNALAIELVRSLTK